MINEVCYLGDGLYVKFDGYMVKLLANSPKMPTDTVCMEPEVLNAFLSYVEALKAFIAQINSKGEPHE